LNSLPNKYLKKYLIEMSHQDFTEAYKSVYEPKEDLQEYSAFLGGTIGRGEKSVTVGGSAGGFSGSAKFGTKKVGGGTDPKAAVDNAIDRYQGKTTAVAKPAAERNVPFASGNFSGSASIGSAPKPAPKPQTSSQPDPTKPKPVTPVRGDGKKPVPTDGRPIPKSEPPKERVQNPSIEFSRKPEPPKDFGRKDNMRMDTTSDLDTYNLVLEYLLDEGFASTEESADKIILNMSESWFEEIMEARRSEKEGKGSPEKRSGEYLIGARGERKRKGDMGGRHFWSGGEGGSRIERGKKKGEDSSQESRLNPEEKSGKYSKMQARKRGSEMGSRFD